MSRLTKVWRAGILVLAAFSITAMGWSGSSGPNPGGVVLQPTGYDLTSCYSHGVGWSGRTMITTATKLSATRSSSYPTSTQDIYMRPILQRLENGAWRNYLYGYWQKKSVPPGYKTSLYAEEVLDNNGAGLPQGWWYRVRYQFHWMVGNVWLGDQWINLYKDDYIAVNCPMRGTFPDGWGGVKT